LLGLQLLVVVSPCENKKLRILFLTSESTGEGFESSLTSIDWKDGCLSIHSIHRQIQTCEDLHELINDSIYASDIVFDASNSLKLAMCICRKYSQASTVVI
jgi:hypothetical protein